MRTQGEDPKKYVGIELQSLAGGGLRLHQQGYIETIMKRFAAERMEEVMPKKPMDRKVGMISREESSKEPFRE